MSNKPGRKKYRRYRRLAAQIHDLACHDKECTYGKPGERDSSWADVHKAHGMTYPCDCWKLVPHVCQYAVDAENIAARGGRRLSWTAHRAVRAGGRLANPEFAVEAAVQLTGWVAAGNDPGGSRPVRLKQPHPEVGCW